jgi:hypothetical protein
MGIGGPRLFREIGFFAGEDVVFCVDVDEFLDDAAEFGWERQQGEIVDVGWARWLVLRWNLRSDCCLRICRHG